MDTNKKETDLPPPDDGSQRHILSAEEELRLEVGFSKHVSTTLQLRSGSAELWGLEMNVGRDYVLKGGGLKLAIFTWHGATVDIAVSDNSMLDSTYSSNETVANVAAVNTHAQLEALRDKALTTESNGPRVLIVGPRESGKTALAKTLTAYAVKLGRTPVLVDLDPADNCLTVPGTLSACVMNDSCLEIESHATTGLPVDAQPLTLWHGSTKIHDRVYSAQIKSLATKLNKRCENDLYCRSAGFIVNTNTMQEQLLLETVSALDITVVLVIGHDRLYSVLSAQTPDMTIVVKLPRSGGVVSRDAAYLTASQNRAIRHYLYGSTNSFTPCAITLPTAPSIYRIRTVELSSHLLPVAQRQTTAAIQYDAVDDPLPDTTLVAVMTTTTTEPDITVGVAGFCVVEDGRRLLSPCAGSLPSNTLLTTTATDTPITWME